MSASAECPGIESWQALFRDDLPPDERDRCERHLESCARCQERLDHAEEFAEALRMRARRVGDPTLVPPDPACGALLERLHGVRSTIRTAPGEPADLYFLRPSERPGVLGLLGNYEVLEVVGQGGMGVVLKAFDPALNRFVAIKVMAAALAGSATARRRFTREAQAAAAVSHDHVVPVHGVSEAGGLPYLVMQYVAGESLQDRIDQTGPLPVEDVVRIGLQTASGLAAAHAQGLIHRDIKPANLLLEDGVARVKITDFGLARMTDDAGLTQAGVVAGTPEYMAPEQARGETVDHRADLYSLGSVLYACCTGVPPFRASTPLAVLRQVNDEEPVPIRTRNADVPAWLEGLVTRLMAKDPAERVETAAEVAALLEGYLAHLRQPAAIPAPKLPPSPAGRRPGSAVRRRFPRRLRLLALVALAVLGGSAFLLTLAMPPSARVTAVKTYQDFHGKRGPRPPLEMIGPDLDAVARLGDKGLRVTLPAGRGPFQPVGVALVGGLSGDFEVTGSYELLAADRPSGGHGVGVALNLATTPDFRRFAKIGRFMRAAEGDVYVVESWSKESAGRPDPASVFRTLPALTHAGRLRLVREGPTLRYLVAEDTPGEFREVYRGQFGTEDVAVVRFIVTQNDSPAAIDARLLDLRVWAAGRAGAGQEGGPSHAWLAAAAALGVVVLLSAAAVRVGLAVRGRRSAGKASDASP